MQIDITQIIIAGCTILSVGVTYIIYPWIRSKIGAAQWNNVCLWASAGVQAAEVLFKGSGKGDEKRDYVMNFIKEKCKEYGITFNADQARIALENAWKQMITIPV